MKTKIDIETSDLFFNLPHPTFDGLFPSGSENKPTQGEMLMAVTEDAAQAIQSYPRTFDGIACDDLANDFMERL